MDADTFISMEDVLIEEVRKRPSIYDKTTAVYKNSRIREHEWKEVAQAVNTKDVEVVKKRWRSLRDSFIKIQRSLKHNPRQVIKWLYYRKLTFLVPHIESKELVLDGSLKNEDDDTTQDTSRGDSEADSGTDFRFVPDDGFSEASTSFPNKTRKRNLDEDPLIVAEQFFEKKKSRVVDDEFSVSVVKEADSDEQFLLSCLPALKRMRARENAIARMRIQQALFDVEFGGEQHNGVFVTKVEEEVE